MKKNIMHRILHGCEEVSLLSVRAAEMPLSLSEQAFLSAHLLFCKCCKNFIKENAAIDTSLHAYFEGMAQQPTQTLTDDFKQQLQKKLQVTE